MAGAAACTATIVGSRARIELDGRFYQPTTMRLIDAAGGVLDTYTPEHQFHGFRYEIAEFARTVAAGQTETERMPHATTLAVMDVLDEARRQVGVGYPGE
jgi:predicted dehydrogenase